MRWKQEIAGLLGICLIMSANTAWAGFRGDMDPPQRAGRDRSTARADRQPVPRLENRQNHAPETRNPDRARRDPNANRPRPNDIHNTRPNDPNRFERRPINYPPNWRPPGPVPQDWHPHNPPPPNWRPFPPPPGYPLRPYPPRFYPGYIAPVLYAPYPGYNVGDVIAGALIVGMVVKAISAASDPVVVNNTTYYYDGDNYYEPVVDGMDTVYRVVDNPYDH